MLCASLKSDIKRRPLTVGVDLERKGKDHISQRQARTPERLRHFFDAVAEFREQGKEPLFLVSLRFVVGAPLLLLAFPDGYRLSVGLSLAIVGLVGLNDDLDSENVFAFELSRGEVRATALRVYEIGFDDVGIATTFGLRWNNQYERKEGLRK